MDNNSFILVQNSSGTNNGSWSIGEVCYFMFDLLAFSFNLLVLSLVYMDRTTRTSFQIYIANLCSVNLLYGFTVFYNVANIKQSFPDRPPWLFCLVLRYLYYITAGLINNAHFLIAVNRVWAITHDQPISYRQYNRNNAIRNPLIICICMWLYAHLWVIPAVAMDTMTPRNPPDLHHCSPRILWSLKWSIAAAMILYNFPIVATCVLCPFILYKTMKRRRQSGRNQVAQSTGQRLVGDSVIQSVLNNQPTQTSISRVLNSQFLTLTVLTLNVIVCLLPAQLFHALPLFGIDPPGAIIVVDTLYTTSPIIDALLFLLTVKSLQDRLKSLFRCNSF